MDINKLKNNFKRTIESKTFYTVMCTLGVLFVAFLIFQAGMIAGFKKASFGRDWGDNYAMNFGSPHRGPERMMRGGFGDFGNLPNAHGAIGKIIKIELPTIVVLDEKDNTEKIVLVNDRTEIHKMRDNLTQGELKIDDHAIVIGTPNSSGQIEARLIRLLPVPFEMPIRTN